MDTNFNITIRKTKQTKGHQNGKINIADFSFLEYHKNPSKGLRRRSPHLQGRLFIYRWHQGGTVIPERQVYSFVAIIESVKLNS